ncbi:MAG: efflux RND transporter periplasmic adaptor subunit [Acidobacteria bacterium]|nr:efflux RND transporter periplasmic adaptor subunit [Acidobacteriota bacterium]
MSVDKDKLDGLKIDRAGVGESRSRPIAIASAVVVVLLAAMGAALFVKRPGSAVVSVAPAEQVAGDGAITLLNASGYVTARRQATVSSKYTGKVVEVLVEEGLEVQEGQLLARLDDSMTRAALRLAESQAESASKALQETRVRIHEAQLEHDRIERLAKEEVASRSDLDRARAQLDSLEARLIVQEQELDVAGRQLVLRKQELDDTLIRAPFAGIVVSKNAQPGEMISPISAGGGFTRTGICTIVDMESLEIEVDVNEAYITRVVAKQKVEAVLDAYPDWKIAAHVITIIPTADRQKATVKVRIGFDERDARVLPDMGAKVAFIAAEEAGAAKPEVIISIPKTALRRDREQDIVFVVQNGKIERRAVKVGGADGTRAQIVRGLTAGESVVVAGPAELAEGDAVRIEKETGE